MSFIELLDVIIYQHLNKRTKISPLITSKLPIYATSLIMFALPISKPRLKSIIFFYQSSPKIKLFLQKNAKFLSAGDSAPISPTHSPYCEFLATHLVICLAALYGKTNTLKICLFTNPYFHFI